MRLLPALICMFACCPVLGDEPAAAAQIPIEDFTRHDEFGTIEISPDGELAALSTGRFGRSILGFIELKSGKLVGGVRAPEPFEIDDFQWVSPTRIIYMLAERYAGMTQPARTGEIFGIDRDGGNHKLIYGYRAGQQKTGTRLRVREASYASAEVISVLKEDEKNILIAEYRWRLMGNWWRHNPDVRPEIFRLNVYSGEKRSVGTAPLRNSAILVDRADNVRFALGLNEQFRQAVSWKAQPDAPWSDFDLPGFREESLTPRRFSADDHSVLFTGVREGETLSSLYRLDLQTRAVERLHAFDGVGVSGLIADFADQQTIGARGYADRPVHHWLKQEDPAARLYVLLQRAFPGQDVRITSTTDDGALAIVFVTSDVNPGDYYLFHVKTGQAEFLRATRVWIDPQQMRPRQPIEITARDGLELHGYVTRPAGEAPHPLIVLPHGGPHGLRDTWEFDPEVQLLANRGYAVLQLNYRGSGGYGMDFEAAGYRQWGARMQDDLTDATRWAIEQGVAQKDRICIYGASYGGYAALMGAAREPDLYRCAIGYAGVYDLELMFTSADVPDFASGRAYLNEVLGDDPADLRSRSPVHNAARIKAPVLLIHGKEDWRADYSHAVRMKKALEEHGKTLEWMALSREGHGVYDEETRLEVYERILAFLDKHL